MTDDDKLLSVAACIAAFGLFDRTWRDAVRDGLVPGAYTGGRGGLLIRFSDARAFARRYFSEHVNVNEPKEPTP